jgi:GNAT superfamily N-acetyltransferase
VRAIADLALRFTTIDLNRHRDICIRFRRDAIICSFGDDGRFERENGADGAGYLNWLAERIAELPEGCVHVWQGDQIVGQMEMRVRLGTQVGYINLSYLAPEHRGTGKGAALHAYATDLFRRLGLEKLNLCVAPGNARALATIANLVGSISAHVPGRPM